MENPTISELVEKDEKERVTQCKAVIDKALLDFNCSIDASIVIRGNGNFPVIHINPNPPKTKA